MKTFLLSLLSRKFLLALGAFITFIANRQYPEALGVVLGYHASNAVGKFAGDK